MELHEYAESSHPLVRIAAYRDIISAKQGLTKQRLALGGPS